MAKNLKTQHGFGSGELSPFLAARSDVDRYAYGARTMENFIPMLQGPARKRPGTKYVHDLKERCWLVPVAFSQTDAWILAFGDSKLKFFTDRGPVVESAKTITGITQASPGVVTSAGHGFSNGDEVYIQAIVGMTELNSRIFVVAGVTANTFTLVDMWGTAVNTTSLTAYSSAGTAKRLYKIVSPYPIADLTDSNGCCLMSFVVSEDVLYICVPGYQPRKLTRTSSTSWAFATFEPAGGPFVGTDPDETRTVYSDVTTGAATLEASANIFASTDVGSLFLLERKLTEAIGAWETGKAFALNTIVRSSGHFYKCVDAGTSGAVTPTHTEGSRFDGADVAAVCQWQYLHSGYGWIEIEGYTDANTVTGTVLSYIPDEAVAVGDASTQWSMGAWSTTLGWPTHVCFFRERLCFGRGTKLWLSVASDFENFRDRDAGVVSEDMAISIDIRQGFNDDIQWLMPSSDLIVGSQGNEFAVSEISTADPLGPSNIASLRGPGYGARRVEPVLVNDGIMYVLPSGRVLRELRFSFETDGYVALNRTAFAEHITKGQINQLSFAKEPESIVWAACADGALIAMSYEREHQLMAWSKHALGGAFSTGNAFVEAIATIPSPDGFSDELYLCVKRTLNGTTKHYLEYLADHWDENTDDLDDMYYVDCGLSSTGNSSTTIAGLEHLLGASVQVLGDGRDMIGPYTVAAASNGAAITLTSTAAPAVVHAGLQYTATLESMNFNAPNVIARIVDVFVKFISTVKAKVAGATTTERKTRATWGPREIGWSFLGIAASSPPQAQSRVMLCKDEGDHGQEVFFKVVHDFPTACTVAGWTVRTEEAK